MKYYKFEKVKKGKNPIIKVTYKTWWGSFVIRDICKCDTVQGFWVFMDNGLLTHNFEPINNFYENDDDIYWVNGRPQ